MKTKILLTFAVGTALLSMNIGNCQTPIRKADSGPEMKVSIDNEGNIGRYLGENENSYHGEIQDEYRVEKSKARIEIFKACDGKGILTLKEPGKKPVFNRPDTGSGTIGSMIYMDGYVPEVYRCLGYGKGWFQTEIDGKPGFIQENLVIWDAINSY